MKLKDSKMNQRLLTCFIWIALCCGCTQSEVVIDNKPKKGEEVSACLRLNILASTTTHTRSMSFTTKGTTETDSVSVTPDDNVTKSTTDPGEAADKEILNLWAGQYNATGELVAEEYFSSLSTQENVNLPLKRIEGTSHVWVVANAGNLQGKASTVNALKALTTSNAFTDDGLPVSNLCMMTGMWSGTITENIKADILLKRSVAKIKFTYSVGGVNFSFTPATLELCNVPIQMKYIGDETPVQLSGDENFKTYTVASPGISGMHYWYIPENPAGTGSNTEDVATNKTGEGVTHATCICLTGEAVQDGVTYGDVVFTLYPGKGNNDYNIVRNGLYTIDVALTGIDFSDKRVTVGTVPEMQDPANLGAEKGAMGIFQVTTRPGLPWAFTVPSWLSAVVGNQTYDSGTRLDFIGPYKVNFETTTANPRAEIRETSFTVGEKTITVKQNPSSLTVGSSIELAAEGGSTGSGTFKATKGLPRSASLSSEWGDWLAWNGDAPASGAEATGENESLAVKAASVNPSKNSRRGTIRVSAGESVSTPDYIDLKKEITVTQAGSTVVGSTTTVAPEAANNQTSSFTATPGLSWVASVANGSWITLATASGDPTLAENTVAYSVTVNPNSSERSDDITVRAGDADTGPTGTIRVTQRASSLTASVSPATALKATKDDSGTFTMNGTEGLTYSFTARFPDWLTVTNSSASTDGGMTTGSDQTLTYKTASVNPNASERSAIVTVKAGNIPKSVTVKQAGSTFTVDKTEIELENTATSGSVTVTGTSGLPWTVSPNVETNGITPATTSATATGSGQTLTFNATKNTSGAREATFTVAGGNHSKTVRVKQKAGVMLVTVTINQSMLEAYCAQVKSNKSTLTVFPPFDADGTDQASSHGITVNLSDSPTMSGAYTIQVQTSQRADKNTYAAMQSYCKTLDEGGTGWRLPTQIELYTMHKNKATIEKAGVSPFIYGYYWSSTVYNDDNNQRCSLNIDGGYFSFNNRTSPYYVRCVRDINN